MRPNGEIRYMQYVPKSLKGEDMIYNLEYALFFCQPHNYVAVPVSFKVRLYRTGEIRDEVL